MATTNTVQNRQVFFLPGFDPAAARDHRERYRREGAAQAVISGYALSVTGSGNTWSAEAEIDGQRSVAEIEVLAWSDLVRREMRAGIWASYLRLVRTAWIYASSGALWRLFGLRKGPVIAALYPVAMLLMQLALAVGLGGLAAAFARGVIGGTGTERAWLAGPVATALWLAIVVLVLRWFRRQDGRFLAHYLMQDYAYASARRGAYPEALNERLAAFTDRIAAALRGSVDEVLIVGHSSGAILAISALADLLRREAVPERPQIALLTLGQVVPMVSFLPRANRLRSDLAFLAQSEAITWVDVTAPGDGCAFALCDPVAVTGVAPPLQRWPLVLSAAFTQTLSAETWTRLRWRFFRLHFQYLSAFDRPDWYDFFAITAGPATLSDRVAGRAASPGRIATPRSGYRDIAP